MERLPEPAPTIPQRRRGPLPLYPRGIEAQVKSGLQEPDQASCLKLKAIEESVLGGLKNVTAAQNWSLKPPKTALRLPNTAPPLTSDK